MIQIATIDPPLNRPSILGPAVTLVRRAMALGLLPGVDRIDRLSMDLVRGIAREASSAGVGQAAAVELMGRPTPIRLGVLIGNLDDALSQSPLPERELKQLTDVFELDQLAKLIGSSSVSLRRYMAGTRSAPDAIAARMHWLALVVGDLAGAYNNIGIRRWFERTRSQLDGKTPRELLGADWDPDDPHVERVRALAAALAGAGAAT